MARETKLFGPDGRPLFAPSDDPLGDLVREGVRDLGDKLEIKKELLARFQEEKARGLAMTSVPGTPRNLIREAGGIAVSKGGGRWPHVTMDMLRNLRRTAPILAPIHRARDTQARRMSRKWPGKRGEVGIRLVHKDHLQHDATPPASIRPYIAQFERTLNCPAPDYDYATLEQANAALMDDLLTINRPVVEMIHSAVDPRRIVQVRPVDGSLIWETLTWVEKWVADNPRWSVGYDVGRLRADDLLDIVSHAVSHDLHGADYCLVRDGIVEAVYPRGKLIVAKIQNTTDVRYVGYPPSHVEQAMMLVSAFMSTFDYNASYFTKGMLAEFILGLPAGMHDDDVDAFVDMFREASQGGPNAWRPPILPLPHGKDTITKIDLKSPNKDMGFETWLSFLIAGVTAVYRMDPSTINMKPWDGGGGPKLSEAGGRTEEIAIAKEEGLQADFGHLLQNVWTPAAQRCHPDLMVIAEYGDFDPQKHASVQEIRARTTATRNQLRIEDGDPPLGFYLDPEAWKTAPPDQQQRHDQNPWNWPTDAVFAGAIAQQQNADLQKQQMQQQAATGQQQPADDFRAGHDDGYGGKDDGFGGRIPGHDPAPYGTLGQGGPPKPGSLSGSSAAPGGAPPAPRALPSPGGAPKPSGGAPAPLAKGRPITVFVED
jgi:hypothetical protein